MTEWSSTADLPSRNNYNISNSLGSCGGRTAKGVGKLIQLGIKQSLYKGLGRSSTVFDQPLKVNTTIPDEESQDHLVELPEDPARRTEVDLKSLVDSGGRNSDRQQSWN